MVVYSTAHSKLAGMYIDLVPHPPQSVPTAPCGCKTGLWVLPKGVSTYSWSASQIMMMVESYGGEHRP